ncbi:MFS transporter, BCD family, chlorophyll transporter [Allochromatium warmingii]|uniref:MFS transporter, BCD family, chlorophyll transporter n=1 Tax=Allochromatium warmingii TaxID=61595 RepID=A0A1H3AUQ7_ALLWA|nr:BCD family MFS transporter [Allochromatium warmingii]SDX33397.1 MFS transporter, BCD family, chlorophyll transporter [Allochromatium warmingii]
MSQPIDPRLLAWRQLVRQLLPFADVATPDLPLSRLLRLSLFQVSIAIAMVLLTGTLNRVMVVELGVPTWLVATMLALPLIFAPFRALIGHRSDYHHSAFGLRRVPYIWFGSMLQFGGFAIMPFALLLLGDASNSLNILGKIGAGLAFLMVGAGLHTTQTAGLALAMDLAPHDKRPRVVALLYVTLLIGMVLSALLFGQLLTNFSQQLLIQLIQGAAVATIALNLVALWKQEAIDSVRAANPTKRPPFLDTWREFATGGQASRLLIVVGLGTAGFTMQDILLEPYGGQVLGMSVSQTTALTALWATGTLAAFVLSGYWLGQGGNTYRLTLIGVLCGLLAFAAVIFAASSGSVTLFRAGTALIGFGGGFFAVGTLTAAMDMAGGEHGGLHSGLALGAWGAVQATANGLAMALGGSLRDAISSMATSGAFGPTLTGPEVGYIVVYGLEILLLVGALVIVVPMALKSGATVMRDSSKIGLDQMP